MERDYVIDKYGSEKERRRARESDTDRNWTELVDDESWHPIVSRGSFAFLDPIGFRYYLPAALVRSLRGGLEDDMLFWLSPTKSKKPPGFKIDEHDLERWTTLDERQRRCIARYVRFMIAWQESPLPDDTEWDVRFAEEARRAYEQYWTQFE